jgi:hypothetical protein
MKAFNMFLVLVALNVIGAAFLAKRPDLRRQLFPPPATLRTATILTIDNDAPVPVSVTLYLRADGTVMWKEDAR